MKDNYDKIQAIREAIMQAATDCCEYLTENRTHFGTKRGGFGPDFRIALDVWNQDKDNWVGTITYVASFKNGGSMEYFKIKEIDKKSNKKSENDV